MGVNLLLFSVIYQTVITASLGGVTLPFSDCIGKVTPIKPKPLPTSTVTSSSPICDSKESSPTAKGPLSREFSLPIVITSSSRALPVPKLNSSLIENVKIPERLEEKFLAPRKGAIRCTKTDICLPNVSLTNKNPFLSSPSSLTNAVPTYFPVEIQKWSPLPSIALLPNDPVECNNELSSSSFKTSQFSSQDGVSFPFSDAIGKVTPIKPKLLPTSTVSSLITSSPSPICDRTNQFSSLDGVTLPFFDSIGKVTPIKPKTLPTSTVSSSSPIRDSTDNPQLFLPTAKESISREFSSPISITSSSRALPVPKIDSSSTLPNVLPTNYPLEINKLYSLHSIKALPDIPVDSLKTIGTDFISSSSKANQFSSVDEVTLPFFDAIGKVIPIKPRPLPTSTVLPSITSTSSLICDSKDSPILFPPTAKGPICREFSSPIAITSSSRALPVPKIDSSSIKNVKIPERLREQSSALCKGPVRSTNPDIRSSQASITNKYPFLLPPSSILCNDLPTYFPLEINKSSLTPSIKPMPDIPVESLKTIGIDSLSSSPKTGQFSSLDGTTLPFCDVIGKVTPIKPKPLPTSTVSSPIISSSSPICDSKDNSTFFPPTAKGPILREFSTPIALTSLSRVLPVPKINSSSIENVKIPEKLREQFLALRKGPVRCIKPDICSSQASLTNKYPSLSPPPKISNDLPTNFPLEIQELSPLPRIMPLSNVPVEYSKDLSSSSPKTSQFSSIPFFDAIGKVTPIKPKPLPTSTVPSPITSSKSPICETSQFSSLDRVALPSSDAIGKVTPIKPKPLSTSTVISPITSSSFPICDTKDNSKLYPPNAKGPISREFSSPIVVTSSSRALPVPKINSSSIENVKIPERLCENVKLRKGPVRNAKPDIRSPQASLTNKYSFLSPPPKISNDLPTNFPLEIQELSPLPRIMPLSNAPVECSTDLSSSSSKTSQFSSLPFFDAIGKVTAIKPKPLPTSTVSSPITSSLSPICETSQFSSLDGVALPFSDTVGIVTPIKPKSLATSTVSSPISSSMSPICETSQLSSLDVVALPFSDTVGIVTPIKPKPLATSTVSSPITSSLSPIYESSQFSSLNGVALPFSDTVGIVTPIKPKPLATSTVSLPITSSLSPICDSTLTPKLFPPTAKEPISRKFSSPIAITSSSRAVPVPKIDSSSIEDVKIPDTLREKFLALRIFKNAKPDIRLPRASLPSVKLSDVPAQSLKTNGINLLRSSSKSGQFSAPVSVTLSPRSRICESPPILEPRKSLFSEQSSAKTFTSLSSTPSSPWHYKSLYLPGVKTPSEPLSYRPFYYKGAGNFDLPSQYSSPNLLNSPTLSSTISPTVPSLINGPCMSSYLNSVNTLPILKPTLPIQLPKTQTNVPISSNIVTPVQNTVIKNLWPPEEVSASVPLEPEIEPKTASCSISLRDDQNIGVDTTSFCILKPGSPLKMKPLILTSPSHYFDTPSTPPMPISISSPKVDMLSNELNRPDCSKSITPETLPAIGICTETIEEIYPNVLVNYQTGLEIMNFNLPRQNPYQPPLFTKECVSTSLNYSPPKIPNEPIPTIFSGTSFCSPLAVTQTPTTPVPYINQSTTPSIRETTSNMVSSIKNLLSNIIQDSLSSFKPYINSALQNVPQTPTFTIQSNPYNDILSQAEQPYPVLTIPQCNPVNSISKLPVVTAPITSDSSNAVSFVPQSAFEVPPSQPLIKSSPQLAAPVPSPTSLKTFLKPPPCPCCLPSPILPSYPAIASPFHIEVPVYQESLSNKDSGVENMNELMLLTEILDNDETFDWNDLDTLLAHLSLS